MTNVEMVEMTDNYFGFPLELPLVLVSYVRSSGSCREPLPYSQVDKVEMMRNMAVKADWTLVELEHSYIEDLGREKVTVDKTFLLLPCQCEAIQVNSNITNVGLLHHLSLPQTDDDVYIPGETLRAPDVVVPLLQQGQDGGQVRGLSQSGTLQPHRLHGHRGEDVLSGRWSQPCPGGDHHGAGHGPDHGAGGDGRHEARLWSGHQGGRGWEEGGLTVEL